MSNYINHPRKEQVLLQNYSLLRSKENTCVRVREQWWRREWSQTVRRRRTGTSSHTSLTERRYLKPGKEATAFIHVRKTGFSLIFKRSRKLSFVSLRSLQQKYNYINILQLNVIHVSDPFINFMWKVLIVINNVIVSNCTLYSVRST